MDRQINNFKKYIRSVAVAIGITIALLTAGHLFISYKIRQLLPKLVTQLSEGHYELRYYTLDFHYFRPKLLLTGIHMKPVGDSLETAYTVSIDSISLSINSYLPLFLKGRQINVEEIRLVRPLVIGKRIQPMAKRSEDAELHIQINRLQQNAIRFLNALQVNACSLINAHFQYYPFPGQQRHFNLENIDLSIKDLIIPSDQDKMIEASIRLNLLNPKLRIPDSSLQISLDRFVWDNQQHYVEAAAFKIAQQQTARRDSFQIQLQAIRIRKINWLLWLDSGIVRFDTVLTKDGKLFFSSRPDRIRTKKDTTSFKRMKFWDAIGDLDIQHFSAQHIQAALIDQRPGQERNYALLGDTLAINGLSIRPSRDIPLTVKDLGLSVREFSDEGKGNKFKTYFSKLKLKENTIALTEYLIQSTRQSKLGAGSSLYIPELFIKGLSFQDLFDKKASVQEIEMRFPELQLSLKNDRKRSISFSGFDDIRPYVDVNRLLIYNATIEIKEQQSFIKSKGISADILAHDALLSNNPDALFSSLRDVDLQLLELHFPQHHFVLRNGTVDYRNKSLQFADVSLDLLKEKIKADLQQVAIDAVPESRPLEMGRLWQFEKVQIGKGNISVNGALNKMSMGNANAINLNIDKMHLGNIHFNYIDPRTNAEANVEVTNAQNVEWKDGILSWTQAETNGRDLRLELPGVDVFSKQFKLNSTGESVLDSAAIKISKPGIVAEINARQIITNEDFKRYDPDTLVFDRIVLVRPKINATLFDAAKEKQVQKNFLIGSKQFEWEDPSIHISVAGNADPLHFETQGSSISGQELYYDQERSSVRFSAQDLNLDLSSLSIRSEGQDIFNSGSLQASLHNMMHDHRLHQDMIFDIDRLAMQDIDLSRLKRGDTISWRTKGIDLRTMNRIYLNKDSILLSAFKLPPMRIYPGTFIYRTPKSAFDIYQLNVNTESKYLSWDSLNVINRVPREQYFKQFPFEKDYFTINAGRLEAFGLQPLIKGDDTIAYARKITVDPLIMKIERDKRMNDDTVSYRPLLAGLVKKLRVPVILDSLELIRSIVWHNVIDEKTEKEATIYFTDLNAQVKRLKNIDVSEKDSIVLNVDAKLMGKGDLQLRYRQNYRAPHQSFSMGIRVGEMDMQELNRLIFPLQSVKIERGWIDHIAIDVSGNDNIAYGKIGMDYADLKVSVVNRANQHRSIISMLANLFLRGKNHRSNPIVVERIKSKSVFNYWSRISLNGLLTSIGVRKNAKKTREFLRQKEKNDRVENLF